jgi:hypothetical protein
VAIAPMTKVRGLHTFSNYLSGVPEGALIEADNVNIDRDGVIESRRGITQYGDIGSLTTDTAEQLLLYKNKLITHYGSKLAYDASGTFTDYAWTHNSADSDFRTKGVEINGNLYITSANGITKIASKDAAGIPTAKITYAGPIKAATGYGVCNFSTTGFFAGYSKVNYSVTWATKDVNNNIIEGYPSPLIQVINQSANSCTVNLTFDVPVGITTDYFYRVYRSNIITAANFAGLDDISPSAELNLVIEEGYVSGTTVTVNDITPEDFRNSGLPLYTNEFSGEGILQANDTIPFAKDIALYKNHVFLSNTRTKHRSIINLLGIANITNSRINAIGDGVQIIGLSYSAPNTTITFSSNPGLVAGQKVVILGSASALDGIQTIVSSSGTAPYTTVIAADSTGAVSAKTSIYPNSITTSRGIVSNKYYFVGRPEINEITFPAAINITPACYFDIYSANDAIKYRVWYDTTGSDLPPAVSTESLLRVDISPIFSGGTAIQVATYTMNEINSATSDFTITQTPATDKLTFECVESGGTTNPVDSGTSNITVLNLQNGHGEDIGNKYILLSNYVSPAQAIDASTRSLVRCINSNLSDILFAYYIYSANDVPGKFVLESEDLDTTAFTIQGNNSIVGESFNPTITTAYSSENEVKPNRVYYSKQSQPESIPLLNYVDVGPQDKAVMRILGLRDSLFILKEDGVYRLSGDNSSNFFVTQFDNSANITAPDTAVVLNNQIYVLTSQGIARISETGVSIISRPIENIFNRISSSLFPNYHSASFGCAYEADRSYLLWVPENYTDTTAKRCYRFNTFTEAWTSWTVDAKCAIVNPDVHINKLFVGPSDDNIIEVERKGLTREDYADRQYAQTILDDAVTTNGVLFASTTRFDIGDVVVQKQYVTIALVERLAKKIAIDGGVPNTVGNNNKLFYSNFTVEPGSNLQNKVSTLITQLNSDIGSAFNTTYSADFATFQTQYNAVIAAMNLNNTLIFSNYSLSTGTINYELMVTGINTRYNTIEVLATTNIISGPCTLYKAINSKVTYAPQHFGNPSSLKHVRESTIMFETATLAFGKLGFNSDLSPGFEDIDFAMEGSGSWSTFYYDNTTWGGEGSAVPFRTLVPRQKQRCRFIRSRFMHSTAFYNFAILGISYVFEETSTRAYK